MKKVVLLAFVLTFLSLGVVGRFVSADIVGVSMTQEVAPDFTLTDINGTEFSLSDYRGKVVLIDFCRVEPNCPPCIYEIPHLKDVYNNYSQSEVVIMFISVSSLDTNDTLRNFVEEYGIPWIVACGGTEIADKYSISAVPTLVIVDAEGYIAYRHEGVTEGSTLISEIESLLPTPVGGLWIPINKLELLAPYIGLAILLAVAVITVVYVKKRKRDTEINDVYLANF